jgi:sulfur relay (sulfurtransferase) DsrF/TusC family protein
MIALKIYYNEYEAREGLFKVKIITDNQNIIRDVIIIGDFSVYPKEDIWIIEDSLKDVRFEDETVSSIVSGVFEKENSTLVGRALDELIETAVEERPVE